MCEYGEDEDEEDEEGEEEGRRQEERRPGGPYGAGGGPQEWSAVGRRREGESRRVQSYLHICLQRPSSDRRSCSLLYSEPLSKSDPTYFGSELVMTICFTERSSCRVVLFVAISFQTNLVSRTYPSIGSTSKD